LYEFRDRLERRETLSHRPRDAVHQNAAIFEFVRAFDHILLPWKCCDDTSNSLRVTVLTNTHIHRSTTHLATLSMHGWSVIISCCFILWFLI